MADRLSSGIAAGRFDSPGGQIGSIVGHLSAADAGWIARA